MAQAPIEIELPGLEQTAVIRSFVKNKDRKAVNRILLAGKEFGEGDDMENIKVSATNALDSVEVRCRALLISVGDVTTNPYDVLLNSEHEEDIDLVEKAVQGIFDKSGGSEATEKK